MKELLQVSQFVFCAGGRSTNCSYLCACGEVSDVSISTCNSVKSLLQMDDAVLQFCGSMHAERLFAVASPVGVSNDCSLRPPLNAPSLPVSALQPLVFFINWCCSCLSFLFSQPRNSIYFGTKKRSFLKNYTLFLLCIQSFLGLVLILKHKKTTVGYQLLIYTRLLVLCSDTSVCSVVAKFLPLSNFQYTFYFTALLPQHCGWCLLSIYVF